MKIQQLIQILIIILSIRFNEMKHKSMNNNYFKNYYNENKNTILDRLSINQKRRYKEDIEFKLLKRIQARIKN